MKYHPFIATSLYVAMSLTLVACSNDERRPGVNEYQDMGVDRDAMAPDVDDPRVEVSAVRIFGAESRTFDDCMFASPLAFERDGETEIIVVAGETVAALDPVDGSEAWSVTLPAPDGERAFAMATPGRAGNLLVFTYHTTERNDDPRDGAKDRIRHMAAVVDLEARQIAPQFDPVELDGPFESNQGGEVDFPATNALGRAEVATAGATDSSLGYAYITFGNARDIQPWHGFAFELNLDAWVDSGAQAAISGRLVTTPEEDCGRSGVSGSRDRICGGGLWAPSGPLVVEDHDGFDIVLAPGNGQLDIEREDFANTLMKISGPGLEFDAACDGQACADFDVDEPSLDCVESCENLFVPRMPDGPPRPESGACDGMTIFECWQRLDYIGGSTPAYIETDGRRLLAYPTKDGAVYLVDFDNLGTMHDREQLVAICGTADENCRWDWAGMIVTEPAVTTLDGMPLLIVPTFMPDTSHPAGIVALFVESDEVGARLEVAWQAPNFSTEESVRRFREHPSRPVLQTLSNGVELVWVVEALRSQSRGRLVGVRVWDGAIVEDTALDGPGNRFNQPLVVGDRVYLASCGTDRDSSFLEGYRIQEERSE